MTRTALAIAAALLAPAALAEVPPAAAGASPPAEAPGGGEVRGELPPPRLVPAPEKPLPRGAVLEEVVGTVASVDREGHRITVQTTAGPVTLSLDRNTLVYGPRGLGTVLDLVPGAPVRAGRNADMVAFWVTVRAPARSPEPGATPGQGTGPGGAAAPPAEGRPPVSAPPATPGAGPGPTQPAR